MSRMKDLPFTSFAGGVVSYRFPAEFSERQWQELYGFVIEGGGKLRAQWECQKVANPTLAGDITRVGTFVTGDNRYLVAVTTGGVIKYALVPADSALPSSGAQGEALYPTWNTLSTGTDVVTSGTVSISVNTSWRPLCSVPAARVGAGYTSTRKSAYFMSFHGSDQSLLLFETATGTLAADIYPASRQYPTFHYANEYGNTSVPAENLVEYATKGYLPRGSVACMWNDVLCIADTDWFSDQAGGLADYKTTPLSGSNSSRYRSGFWTSYVSPQGFVDATAFHPVKSFNYGFLSPEAVIVDMRVCDQGLLVFTREATQRDGLVLLRGTPYDYVPVVLRGGIGLPAEGHATGWSDASLWSFVDNAGSVWQTDGTACDRLDRVGPVVAQDALTCMYDQTASIGSWLVALRSNTLHVLNLLDRDANGSGDAAWTQLHKPSGTATQVFALGRCIYLLNSGILYRYALDSARRGRTAGALSVSKVSTGVLGDPNAAKKLRWARGTVRAHSETGTGTLDVIFSLAGGLHEQTVPPFITRNVNASVGDSLVMVVPLHGMSRMCTVTAEFTGDVTVDEVIVAVAGMTDDRTDGEN